MSTPPPYVPSQSYTTYQASHQLPGPALQGTDLDTEFNRLKATTDALINNLNLLQRGDGALNNQSVSPDTITSSLAILIAGWNIRGAWVTVTSYLVKDYVTNAGNGYVCIVAHTAGTFATDLAAGKWALVATQGATGPQGIQGLPGSSGISGVTRPGFVNRLINGDFAVDQRNESAAQTLTAGAAVAYTVDRWYASCSGANITGQRAIGTGANQFGYQFTGAASNTGLVFGHRIEANNVADLLSQQVAVQVMLSATPATTVTWKTFFANTINAFGSKTTSGTGTETQIDTGTIVVTATPTLYTFTTNLGASAGKGIDLEFSCGALLGAQTIKFESIQLEFGATANPFERQDITVRLARCQRYYEKSYSQGVALAAITSNGSFNYTTAAPTSFNNQQPLKVVKFANPVVVIYSPATGATGNVRDVSNGADRAATANNIGDASFNVNCAATGAGALNTWHFSAAAEL